MANNVDRESNPMTDYNLSLSTVDVLADALVCYDDRSCVPEGPDAFENSCRIARAAARILESMSDEDRQPIWMCEHCAADLTVVDGRWVDSETHVTCSYHHGMSMRIGLEHVPTEIASPAAKLWLLASSPLLDWERAHTLDWRTITVQGHEHVTDDEIAYLHAAGYSVVLEPSMEEA